MATSKIKSFITTEYRFNGVPNSNGYLATELPLSGYVPIGVKNPTRDGWQYEFIQYRSMDDTNWTMRIVSTNTPTGTFEGRIIAIRLRGGVIPKQLLTELCSGGRHDERDKVTDRIYRENSVHDRRSAKRPNEIHIKRTNNELELNSNKVPYAQNRNYVPDVYISETGFRVRNRLSKQWPKCVWGIRKQSDVFCKGDGWNRISVYRNHHWYIPSLTGSEVA